MALLIDGYNLLYVTGVFGRPTGPGNLERSRAALLNFVAAALDPEERERTTVVFDAKDAPPDLPPITTHQGLTVRFATGYEEADTLIEELIRSESAPKQLTVVSTDRRIQRAAKRRKAAAVDSEQWYEQLLRSRDERQQRLEDPETKPQAPLSEQEVQRWLDEFCAESGQGELPEQTTSHGHLGLSDPADPVEQPQGDSAVPERVASDKPPLKPNDPLSDQHCQEIGNPFPPGYAEDVFEEEQD